MKHNPLFCLPRNASNQPAWVSAALTFLEPWLKKEGVLGAILTGSRVRGTANPESDIDIHIILDDSVKTRVMGNCQVDGFLIEYFVNSIRQHRVYFRDDFKTATRCDARMLALGRIVADTKAGDVKCLQKEALRWYKKKTPPMKKSSSDFSKYLLWDALDDLQMVKAAGDKVSYVYTRASALNFSLETYAQFLGVELPAPAKRMRLLADASFARQYGFKAFPDIRFVALYKSALRRKDFASVKKTLQYIIDQMGGFDISKRYFKVKEQK